MNWLIVEDALKNRRGHWLEYVSTFVRDLRALGDEVVVLCDRKAQSVVIELTGAKPMLPESIWHRMGDGAGGVRRYLRVPRHAIATFFAMRKFFKKFHRKKQRGHGVGIERIEKRIDETKGLHFQVPGGALGETIEGWPERLGERERAMQMGEAQGEAPDWIFVPTVLVHHLLGWWMLLKMGLVPKKSRVLLFFPNLPIRLDVQNKPHWAGGPTTGLMSWLFARLRKEVGVGKVVLGVETHAMRRALEGLIRIPVLYLPHPVPAKEGRDELSASEYAARFPYPDVKFPLCSTLGENILDAELSPRDADISARPVVFGCYGAARWEKGSDVFLKAIRLILDSKTEKLIALDASYISLDLLRFTIQWVEDFRNVSGNIVSIEQRIQEHTRVEVIGRYFEGNEYERQLKQTDVMVLPYRSPYQLRVSRVVIEAIIQGIPVIATRGTTLFEQAEEYGVVVGCDEGDAESLVTAIMEVAKNFKLMRAIAMEKAAVAAAIFSVRYFREALSRY